MRFTHQDASAATNGDGEARSCGTCRAKGGDVRPQGTQSGPQRSLSVRLGQEIQALSRADRLMAVNLPPLGKLAPIRGIRIGTASAGIKQTQRDDLVVMSLAARHSSIRRVYAEFLQGRAGSSVRGASFARSAPCDSGQQRQCKCGNRVGRHRGCAPVLSLGGRCARRSLETVLPFSTGVIGQRSAVVESCRTAFRRRARRLRRRVGRRSRAGNHDDGHGPEGAVQKIVVAGADVTITGIAKGAGMIRPDMATMLAYIGTDAAVSQRVPRSSRWRSPPMRASIESR